MKNIFTKAVVCAGVMASALALNGIAVFAAVPTVSSDLATISGTTSIVIGEEIGAGWTGTNTSGDLSTNKLIFGYLADKKTNASFSVGGTNYGTTLRLKGLGARSIAIKVSGKCQVVTYGKYHASRSVHIADADGEELQSSVAEYSSDGYETTTLNYTGNGEVLHFYTEGDFNIGRIDVNFGVANVPATGINITSNISDVQVGKSKTLKAQVTPSNATNIGVAWSSSDTDVLTVDENTGVITGVSKGTATVTATSNDGDYTATVDIEVKDAVNLDAVDGTVDDLQEITETKTFTLLSDLQATDPETGVITYSKDKLYCNNQVFIPTAGLYYYADKSAKTISGDATSGALRLKRNQDEFAIKLGAGSTIEIPLTGGASSTERYGTISDAINATKDDAAYAVSTTNLSSSPYNEVFTYTNETNAAQIIYVSATADTYFAEFKVTVPEADTTPYLDLTATQNASTGKARLEATINNVSADNKITSISVKREDKDAATAIKNIKNTNGVYTFAVNFGTPASDTHAVLSLTFLKDGTTETTKTYGFALKTDNTITLD